MNIKNKIAVIGIALFVILGILYSETHQLKLHTDPISKFSIEIPYSWKVVNEIHATTTSDTLFGNGNSTIVVKRFQRTDKVDEAINFMGESEFMVFLADQLKIDIEGYNILSTSTVMINDGSFYKLDANYVGKKSQKEVTQKTYITLTDKSYYIIGIDVYSDKWPRSKEIIEKSIKTFKLLP